MKIAIFYICTGKYSVFWEQFFLSSEQFFLPGHTKEYFVFTDQKIAPLNHRIHIIQQGNLGWPGNTLFRYHMFYSQYESLKHFDYAFYLNANMVFLQVVTDDILPVKEGLVGVIHPGFYNKPRKQFTYETNSQSLAFVAPTEGERYFMGGFSGGRAMDYLELAGTLAENTEIDLEKEIVAIWHDESHLNRYFIDHPVKILPPEYGYPEDWDIPFEKKVIILDKNKLGGHSYLRDIGE